MQYSEANRRRRGKRKKKHYFLNIFIAALVLAAAYYIAFHSGIFDIKEAKISVTGNVYYTPAQVAELSGVKPGENIFKTRVSVVEEKLKQDPYIRGAEASWALPDGLDIVIEERAESVLVKAEKGYVVVDYDGIILRTAEEAPKLPVLEGLTPVAPKAGEALKAEEAGQLMPALDFFKHVEQHDFYIKKLDLAGVIPKAYVFDRLALQGDLANMVKNIEEIKSIVADLDAKGVERGTISVGSGSCSFSPELVHLT